MEQAAGPGGAAVDGLVVVAVAPLVVGPQQDFAGGRQSLRFMEKLFEPRQGVSAARRQPVDRVVEGNDLASQQFAVTFQRFCDATGVVVGPDQHAGGFLCSIARTALAISARLHTGDMPEDRRGENVREMKLWNATRYLDEQYSHHFILHHIGHCFFFGSAAVSSGASPASAVPSVALPFGSAAGVGSGVVSDGGLPGSAASGRGLSGNVA